MNDLHPPATTRSRPDAASVSVVIASDYAGGESKSWKDEARLLRGLALQDFEEPFDVLIVENERHRGTTPPQLFEIVPNLRVRFSSEATSAKLKDEGVREVGGDLVGVFESDVVPCREWLRLLVGHLRDHPDVIAVSGRTTYGDDNTFQRCLTLLDRGYSDRGTSGVSPHILNCGALYRRALLERFPYPDAITPFLSSKLRLERMREAGHVFHYDARVKQQHALEGWPFVRDMRRHTGYADMMSHRRQALDQIPRLMLGRLTREASNYARLGRSYLHWYDWPLALMLLPAARLLEIPGMLDAVRGRSRIPRTGYR